MDFANQTWPVPPDDTPQTRQQLQTLIADRADEARILALIERGADPSKMVDDDNAYSLARRLDYPEDFCAKMDAAFAKWLQPPPQAVPIFITQNADRLLETLKQHGWTVWCGGTGQMGAFAWSSDYRLYYRQWEIRAHEVRIYAMYEITLEVPKAAFEPIGALLTGYGVEWSLESPDE